jgi:hypothetical protein
MGRARGEAVRIGKRESGTPKRRQHFGRSANAMFCRSYARLGAPRSASGTLRKAWILRDAGEALRVTSQSCTSQGRRRKSENSEDSDFTPVLRTAARLSLRRIALALKQRDAASERLLSISAVV